MKRLLLVAALLAPIEACDRGARDQVQSHRVPAGDAAARFLSSIGRPQVVFGVLLAGCLIQPAAGITAARLTLLALVPNNLATEVLKRATFRTRPDGERKRSNASFPSSHASNAFTIAAVLGRFWRRLGPGLWVGAGAVAASRIYLDRHWTSDVVAGAAIGIASALFAVWVFRRRGWVTGVGPPDAA